ncbi:MAG: CoA ester lyase [Betaproteobacteria bacterium]|nr:MAG: CoA ester lyase [Betaproteobacteria bacterium]
MAHAVLRSILFVPGLAADKFAKASASNADGLVLDLEDSVPADSKAEACVTVRRMLEQGAGGKALWVRVNALDTGRTLKDLAAVIPARPFGVVVPKSRGSADLLRISHYLDALEEAAGVPSGATRILLIATELGAALFDMGRYGGVTDRLWGLTWGAEDLAADVGARINRVDGRYTEPFRLARSLVLHAGAAAGVPVYDTPCVDLDNPDVLRAECEEARRDGFAGKLAIHPRHIGPINAAFTASEEELAWSRAVVAAFEANPSSGALRLQGKMIDRPHLRLARRLLGLE